MVLCQGSLNPVYIKWHPCVDAGSERPSTAKSPAGDSHLDPGTVDDTDQWSPRVTLRKKEDSPVKKNKFKNTLCRGLRDWVSPLVLLSVPRVWGRDMDYVEAGLLAPGRSLSGPLRSPHRACLTG